MSWLFARFYDPFMRKAEAGCLGAWRQELLANLEGEVAELGAGTGVNLPYYPASVRRLTLTEPDAQMRSRLAQRRASSNGRVPSVEIAGAAADALPFPDRSLDAVVGTLVLCTVPDPAAVLREVRRVLKPGGAYVFLEHGPAEEGSARLRWQRRLEPAWRVFAEGCNLTRKADASLEAAGFRIEGKQHESMRGAWPILRPTVRGLARAAG
jgi:ubiquinone/menaquinone biosynthesis C-methylase UbiE